MREETIEITTEYIRLDSLLKFSGLAETGGSAKLIIAEERIKVNGEICTARGKKLYDGDTVEIDEIGLALRIKKNEDS
ncbi:MAG: RNA-binding S4 domain-containing protein [Ruminococcus sp.]|nr:RNA-binding S4 domain-containing protein [Ruminococcus sp.]